MKRTRGRFLTFEGLDGSGKSTQLRHLAETLRGLGLEVLTTREPGGTEIGEKARALLLDSRTLGMAPLTELALMFASRAQQIHEVIAPAVRRGAWVLCDRFTDSSEAYQGYGRRLGTKAVHQLHATLCGGLQPDLTLLLLSDVKASVARARRREARKTGGDEGRFELEGQEFYDRVLKGYLTIARRDAKRVVIVEAHRPIPVVRTEIERIVRQRFLKNA